MRSLGLLALAVILLATFFQCCPSATPEIETPTQEVVPSPTPTEVVPTPTDTATPMPPTFTPTLPPPMFTPTPVTPTPIPYDVADIAYFLCDVEALNKLAELTGEIALLPSPGTITCPALQGWQDISEGIREQHGKCPVPKSRYLLAAQDSLEGALDKTAESLFYLSEYCRSPSGGEEYWGACLDAVLEAQLLVNESTIAFEAFMAGGSDAEEATPGYAIYTSAELRFSAEYPDGWDVEEVLHPPNHHPPEGGVVTFHPPGAPLVKTSGIGVHVQMTAGGRLLSPEELPTDDEYIDFMNDWIDWIDVTPAEIVVEPSIIEVDGYKAVEVITSGTGEYAGYVIGAAFIAVEDRTFFVNVACRADEQDDYCSIYEHFITTFDVLPMP